MHQSKTDKQDLRIPIEHFHKQLDLLQGIISRMAANSASAKNYVISLVVALLALDQVQQHSDLLRIAYLPILFFCFLDAYYLSLERYFKDQYRALVLDWQKGTLEASHLFTIQPSDKGQKGMLAVIKAVGSYSIFPFYGALLLTVALLDYFW